jgi:hypothetical protein
MRNVELLEWAAQRQDLAAWLRSLADLVESDGLACEPIAATVILSGHSGDEILHMGYGAEHGYFNDAAVAMAKVASQPPEHRAGESHHPRSKN